MRPEVVHLGVFPPEQRAQTTALACSLPRQQGLALARHSSSSISRQLIESGQVNSISSATVRRWLAKDKIKPWRYKSWQHILDPKAFLVRAKPVLRLYQHAHLLNQRGIWVVCCDEKTSLQARCPEQPTVAPSTCGQMLVNGRYHRLGAVQLFAALSVADGKVLGMCQSHKAFADFKAFLTQKVLPEAVQRKVKRLVLILDNGPTHAPKQLENWLRAEVAQLGFKFSVKVQWLPVRASWLDQIEIWFSQLQSKLLRPNDFDTLEALVKAIENFIVYCNQAAKPINWSYTVEKLKHKLAANF